MTTIVKAPKHGDYENNIFARSLTYREASMTSLVEHCSLYPNLWQTQQTLAGK